MTEPPLWWRKPRVVSVIVEPLSWFMPHAARLVASLGEAGDDARLVERLDDLPSGAIAFYLSFLRIVPPAILARNQRNLVVHASALPKGRGFSPMVWLTLEGAREIPVRMIVATSPVDSGDIVMADALRFAGHELNGEMRETLGEKVCDMCRRYLVSPTPPAGEPQVGEPSWYRRRHADDSRLDPARPIAEQFEQLRTVDNERYPAFFDHRGHRYILRIEKAGLSPVKSRPA